jgi:hypothetical protein
VGSLRQEANVSGYPGDMASDDRLSFRFGKKIDIPKASDAA